MGGNDSQKLRPWRGNTLLSGAHQTSGSANHHCNRNPRWVLAGHNFPQPAGSWLSYRLPGSLLESRPGSLLASAEAISVFPGFLERGLHRRERQHERQRCVQQGHSAVAGIPSSCSFILGVDDKRHTANLRRGQQAASARREQKLSANSLPLKPAIHSQTRQAESRHIVTCQPSAYDLRSPGIVDRSRAQAVEAENGFVIGIVNGKERFRPAQVVALACITAQELIQRFLAADEPFPIVFPIDRLSAPRGHD